jgi:acetyl esterase
MIAKILGAVAALAVMSTASTGMAADSKEAREAKAQIWQIGKKWNTDVGVQTRAIYAPIYAKYADKTAQEVKTTRDVAYGPDEKQKVDLHLPAKKGTGQPMIAFFHGGGQTGGDKETVANVTEWAARNGMVGVNANYRLSPQVKYPEQGKDVAALVAFMKKNAKEWGGDPNRIYLIGQSAGSTIIAAYIYDQALQPGGDPGVVGVVLMSGVYNTAHQGPRRAFSEAYYGTDESKWDELAPMGKAKSYAGKKVPTLITNAELNPDTIEHESVDLYQLLCKKSGCPRYHQTLGHNHLSESSNLNTNDQSIAPAILEFIQATRPGNARIAAAK